MALTNIAPYYANAAKLKRGEFIFNGMLSSDLRVVQESRPSIPAPTRKQSFISVPYKSGDPIVDESAWENIEFPVDMHFLADTQAEHDALKAAIHQWLTPGFYVDLIFAFDPDTVYHAVVTSPGDFKGVVFHGFNERFTVTFNAKPFKTKKTSLNKSYTIAAGGSLQLTNPTGFSALPKVTTKRNNTERNITVKQGSKTVSTMRYPANLGVGTQGEKIVVDSSVPIVYTVDDLGAAKLVPSLVAVRNGVYLSLPSGTSTITWTGPETLTLEVGWKFL